jgi:hypothetical protein
LAHDTKIEQIARGKSKKSHTPVSRKCGLFVVNLLRINILFLDFYINLKGSGFGAFNSGYFVQAIFSGM